MRAYRISSSVWQRTPLDGEGSFRYGGRWTSRGIRVAYTSASAALAQLEYLAHVTPARLKRGLVYSVVIIPDDLTIQAVDDQHLPADWRDEPAPASTRTIGDDWAESGRSAVLSVPSVMLPLEIGGERNFLINLAHGDFDRIRLAAPAPFVYDVRILRRRARS